MSLQQQSGGNERFVRRYEYDDSWVIAADVGFTTGDVDVDIVGETAIVVVDNGEEIAEAEFDLPGPDASVTVNNGVLAIRVAK